MESFGVRCVFGLAVVSLVQASSVQASHPVSQVESVRRATAPNPHFTLPIRTGVKRTLVTGDIPVHPSQIVDLTEALTPGFLPVVDTNRAAGDHVTNYRVELFGTQRPPPFRPVPLSQVLLPSTHHFAVVGTPQQNISRFFGLAAVALAVLLALFAWGFRAQFHHSGTALPDTQSPALIAAFARAAKIAAAAAWFIAVTDLAGWAFGIEALTRMLAGYVRMMPNTAIAFLFAATCLLLADVPGRLQSMLQRICGAVVTSIGGLTLLEYVSGQDLHIDNLLFSQSFDISVQGEPNRMAFVTALGLLLLGCALLLNNRRRFILPAQWFAIGSGVVCMLNLVGYLYGLQDTEVSPQKFMAVHTALSFLLLSLSVLFRSAGLGVMAALCSASLGGVMGRRLIPAALLLPAIIGWVVWQGELGGLYGTVFCLSVFMSANMAAFGFLIWTSALLLNRLDEARSHTERELRLLVDGTKDYAIFMLDRDGNIAGWNGGAERIKGYSAQEAIGRHLSFLYEAEDMPAGQAQERAGEALRIASSEGRYEEEAWHVRRDGARFWAHVVITALRDKTGHLHGFSNVTRDATELKKATTDLVSACQRAEDANRAKSDFLATMSHEIRTPMNSILGMTDLVMETGLNSIQREYVDRCRRAGANLLNLINDILDLSKIESSRFELERIPFNLSDLALRTCDLIGPKAHLKGIALRTQMTPDTPVALVGDPYRLQQLLLNLLGNAVKFTEQGEIVLKITQHADGEQGHLLFEVTDTGIGIPADKLGSIFEDFIQAESSTTRRFGGSGLGLGIARRLANHMAGELTVSSVLGQGSTFRFDAHFLVSQEPLPLELPTPAHELVGRRVLVIDGNATNRMITSRMCFSWGMIPVETSSIADACALLQDEVRQQRSFSLTIMDVVTPGAEGFDLFLKMQALCPQMPVIMTSSDNEPGEATKAKAAGATAYAVNPVSSTDLFRLVAAAVRPDQANEAPGSVGENDSGVLKILVAEDSEDNRFLLEAYLMNQPYAVTFVENGEEAIRAFQQDVFGLVLMDVQMPVMDGLKATDLIRQFELKNGRHRTPILALTANAFLSDRELSHAAGCDGHLSKPISRETFVSAVRAAVLSHAPAR